MSIQPITGKPKAWNKTFHDRPYKVSTYEGIVRKLVAAAEAARKEELGILDEYKRVVLLTSDLPRNQKKPRLDAASLIQKQRSSENRMKFRALLSSLDDEIRGSIPELKFLYEREIDAGMRKYYEKHSDIRTLEMQAANLSSRYQNANFAKASSAFLDAIEAEDVPTLYYFDRYSPLRDQLDSLIRPWREKVASKMNPTLGKVLVLLTKFVNLPQLLSKVIGDPSNSKNYLIPQGTPVGEAPADQMLFTLLQVAT